MVVEAIKNGFVIGNHSYSHPPFSAISVDDACEEIARTDKLIDTIYLQAGQERPAKWFRFPYGDTGDLRYGKLFNKFSSKDNKRKKLLQSFLRSLNYTQPNFAGITYRYYTKTLRSQIDWSWTFDTMDWALLAESGPATFKELTKRLNQKHPKDFRGFWMFSKRWINTLSDEIILMHDHKNSTLFFPKIIELLSTISNQFELPGIVTHDSASLPLPR